MRHIHLQPLGGVAGDMFVACLLDAFPEHREEAARLAGEMAAVACRVEPHRDDALAGSRFIAAAPAGSHHQHTAWRDIQRQILDARLPSFVERHAIGIFTALAEAEARVHGVAAGDVTFHEVGAADSIADIVAAASVIAAVSPARWSVSPLPIGGGTVETAHGTMPVPAPATALLLEGFALQDDGLAGERVTPTGAAILRYLGCGNAASAGGILRRSGTGFGSRRLPGRSNCVRALVFDSEDTPPIGHRDLAVITFEVDDQSPEDLALGLAHIRAAPGVHDIVQMACFGKKSRVATQVQVLAAPETLDNVIRWCFTETTTIGLRTHLVQGRGLVRHMTEVGVAGQMVPVKLVERPTERGATVMTGKAEADAVRDLETHAMRKDIRTEAERLAIALAKKGGSA